MAARIVEGTLRSWNQCPTDLLQMWCESLRLLTGGPKNPLSSDEVGFCCGGEKNRADAQQLLDLVWEQKRDLVYLTFNENFEQGPIGISLAIRQHDDVRWIPNCDPFVGNLGEQLAIISATEIYAFDNGYLSKSAALGQPANREVGRSNAWVMWRQMASRINTDVLYGAKFLPKGAFLEQAISLDP